MPPFQQRLSVNGWHILLHLGLPSRMVYAAMPPGSYDSDTIDAIRAAAKEYYPEHETLSFYTEED